MITLYPSPVAQISAAYETFVKVVLDICLLCHIALVERVHL